VKTSREFDNLRGPILRSVSRSFYLSLRILPNALRDPLSLAYLLARATDSIADTPEPSVNVRAAALRDLAGAIERTSLRREVIRLRDSFAPLQSNQAERTLIDALPAALDWLDALDEADRRKVRDVLKKITRGQMLDLERFGAGDEVVALPRAADLDEYTYLVAGCVGEFWTRICFAHVKSFTARAESEMLELGVQYGKGLQLINVLRDLGSDLRQSRCYLPEDELHSLGLAPGEILRNPTRVEPLVRKWLEQAERNLAAGIDYACEIRNRRIRFATALPALIGACTLALLRETGTEILEIKVKVSRPEVRKIVSSLARTLASPRSIRKKFERLLRVR